MSDISIEVLDGVIFGWIKKSDHSEETLKLKVDIGGEFDGFVTALRMDPDHAEHFYFKYKGQNSQDLEPRNNIYSIDDIKITPAVDVLGNIEIVPEHIFATDEAASDNLLDQNILVNEIPSDEDRGDNPLLDTEYGLDDPFLASVADSQNGSIVGFVETVYPKQIVGWARDLAAPQYPLTIRVYKGDLLIAEGIADKGRTDIQDEDGQISVIAHGVGKKVLRGGRLADSPYGCHRRRFMC